MSVYLRSAVMHPLCRLPTPPGGRILRIQEESLHPGRVERKRGENDSAPAAPWGPRLSPRHSAESYPLPLDTTLSPYNHHTNIHIYVVAAVAFELTLEFQNQEKPTDGR